MGGSGLKPCPFCWGEAEVIHQTYDAFFVICHGCLTTSKTYHTEAEAIAAWNTRAERTCHVEYMPKNKELRMAPWIECSECCGELPVLITANYCPNCGAKVIT